MNCALKLTGNVLSCNIVHGASPAMERSPGIVHVLVVRKIFSGNLDVINFYFASLNIKT